MKTAREIAIQVLPHFARHVLAGRVLNYGVYAKAIGRDPAKDGLAIGQAMHAIGAACIFTTTPVAPLHFVQRADGGWRGVFEADNAESIHVLPHYDLLATTARIFTYSAKDFALVEQCLRDVLSELPPDLQSPHRMWHIAIHVKAGNTTYLLRALERYEKIRSEAKSAWEREHRL